jgi:CheY-like chemotaxis protein
MARHDDHPRPHLLVVDDDPDLPEMLARALADDGYAVTVCHDGRDVPHLIDAVQPAALIVDVLMPGTDGWTVLRALRATPAGRRLPVVLMSGAWRPHEQQREIGTTRHIAPTVILPKPFALADLARCLRQVGVQPD